MRILQSLTVVILPLFTLVLGWQLGASYQEKQLHDMQHHLDLLYSGETASGTLLTDPENEVDLALMWGVWRLLLRHYIEPDDLDTSKMIFGAVGGLVDAIDDPYTVFMTPTENKEFHQGLQGRLEGIGAQLTMRDGSVVVVAPLKGSPASEAGLLPEDVIFLVDGEDIRSETLNQVVQRIRGPKGTTVAITVARVGADEPIELTIRRAAIKVPSVESEIKSSGSGSIGYIALNQFGDSSVREFRDALAEMRGQELDGIIIDVRFNGGGYLEGAVSISSMFLESGKIVTVERREGDPVHHYASGRPSDPEIPLAILINEGSASASEILAGALQDHDRAKVVGMKSFGKGTVQEVYDLPGNASARITVAKWVTPSGRNLGKEGVEPDISVERTRDHMEQKLDPQLDAALEWLLDGEELADPVKEE